MQALTKTWTSALGKRRTLGALSQQHLSNIYWFLKVFFNESGTACSTMRSIQQVIDYRFTTGIKPWKPLPIPGEVTAIKSQKYCNVYSDGTIVLHGKPIGSLKHIQCWEDM
jgi:hypothetical protein